MTIALALLVPLAAASLSQGGVKVTDSPPPIVAIPTYPPRVLVPAPYPVTMVPPRPLPKLIRAPQPRLPAQALISVNDYPASALAQGEEGRVGFRLDVGPNGRVLGCTIQRSSGSPALDSTTCRLMRARARFTPGIDSSGQPAPGRVSDEIVWRLPVASERG